MTRIPAEQVKKDNSNLYACDDEQRTLYRALRKEKGKNPDLTVNYHLFAPLLPQHHNPYPDLDFRLDLEAFMGRLEPERRELFALYLQGFSPQQMANNTQWALKTVYAKVNKLISEFAVFYEEGAHE